MVWVLSQGQPARTASMTSNSRLNADNLSSIVNRFGLQKEEINVFKSKNTTLTLFTLMAEEHPPSPDRVNDTLPFGRLRVKPAMRVKGSCECFFVLSAAPPIIIVFSYLCSPNGKTKTPYLFRAAYLIINGKGNECTIEPPQL